MAEGGAEAYPEWTTDANDAVHISLVVPANAGAPRPLHTFNPKMTYSIFEDERIFGFQGLKINLRYNACDMRPGLQITYSKKFTAIGETEPADVKALLEPFLPKTAFDKASVFDKAVSESMYASWKPPGDLWKAYDSDDQTFEVWKGSLADMAVQQMVRRIQILVPLFIEGGTILDLEDDDWSLDRWTVFFLYEKKKEVTDGLSPYTFMGYTTVWRSYYLDTGKSKGTHATDKGSMAPPKKQNISKPATADFTLPFLDSNKSSSLPSRCRISQFIVLPPFHHSGNGSRFYNSIFDFYLAEEQTTEITVEDPNYAFDDMRDVNDLARLREIPEFAALRINTSLQTRKKGTVPRDIVDPIKLGNIRKQIKIAPRQFDRVVEMQLLSLIPPGIRQSLLAEEEKAFKSDLKLGVAEKKEKEHEYKLWILMVKKRLYRHNKDTLMQLDRVERIEKLEEVIGGVEADYARLLRALECRGKPSNGQVAGLVEGTKKRGTPMDQDETGVEGEEGPASKKVKIGS